MKMTHTTKHGNEYTDKEWAEKQRQFKVKDDNNAKIQKMLKWAEGQMNAKGLKGHWLKDHIDEIDMMIEAGKIKCSQETAIWLSDLADRFLDACDKLECVNPIG